MADFLIRVEVEPWTPSGFMGVCRRLQAEGFSTHVQLNGQRCALPPGEFVISGPLSAQEVEDRAGEALRQLGLHFTLLTSRFVELRYQRDKAHQRAA
ncbi:hypothetical protein [Rubrivivax rivuli]|uniref:Uncharacterized protein n=1 Tax=Rubrivivax rivuli TaxID=1862385 RepID=A0A437RB37_9BURK|nr:hypothetical protein [Rubrivivax rivuli]RVU43897.1 hypothetical protein EOE66_19780 [Rubrivivax rivuli]